jgi:hypothetical protein
LASRVHDWRELRADVPDEHEEVKKSYLALSLKHSVTYKYPSIYTYSWFGDVVRFLVKDPPTGDYKLILKAHWSRSRGRPSHSASPNGRPRGA